MAIKINSSIMEGRIGNVVFYQSNGKQCARIVPQHFNNPNTPAQQKQRTKMKIVQQWLLPLKDVLRMGFVEGDRGTYYSRAVSATMLQAVVSEGDEQHIDPTLALVAQGTLTPMLNGQVQLTANGQQPTAIKINWTVGEKTVHSHVDDKLFWALYNENSGKVITNAKHSPKPRRNSGSCLIDLSNAKAGTYHLYAFFTNSKMTQSSDSTYLGEVTL